MQGVEIINLNTVKEDERGSIFEFINRNSKSLLLIKRKQGTISGRHYHTGKNPEKDPETLVLVEGKVKIILKNIKTNEEFSQIFSEPVMLKIDPFIYHEIQALTDIILIDMNSFEADKDDTIRV